MITLVQPYDRESAVRPVTITSRRQIHRIRKHGGILLPDDIFSEIGIWAASQHTIRGKFHSYRIRRCRLYIPSLDEIDKINGIIINGIMTE